MLIEKVNKKQILILLLGLVAFVRVGLEPPWTTKAILNDGRRIEYVMHSSICGNHKFKIGNLQLGQGHIAIPLLLVEWTMVAVVTGGLLVVFRSRS